MIELKFYFRLEKELQLALDDDGNYAEVYSCCTLTVEKTPTNEQINELEEGYRTAIAEQLKSDKKYIVSISREEYNKNVDDEDEVVQ